MFSDKGFADGANVDLSSGSAAVVIEVNATAVTGAGKNPAENSAGQPISAIDELLKQGWIKEIVREPIAFVW